ncbi:chromate transporter [Paenibacillus marchantiophytorum]|uniref:Chromate transporter n=1 Tax=Paenibacillus marchantiophytorum TaxID=1619310 RepID=A0ABQ2BQS6_9BACL|nr:chromate efflux transporter [Paenibacillus marchantiophytorum]GGI43946.1 chromate transporter [Paenibacillus marchantiophytorum]
MKPASILQSVKRSPYLEVLWVSTKLGLTSFGGPIAHLGYFHHEYIQKRKWMDEKSYADLVALCQFLPGPASSQVGIGIGTIRAGLLGGALAWLGFTLPSILILLFFALLMQTMDISSAGWIHGLKIVAVAIVAQAVLSMGKKLAATKSTASIAFVAASITLLWQEVYSQLLIIFLAGLIGMFAFKTVSQQENNSLIEIRVPRSAAILCLILYVLLLVVLPTISSLGHSQSLALFDSFYRVGSLVFGGGHVILPLLEREVVPPGWISKEVFLAGYGAAQAVPGPLFTFATYLGAMFLGFKGAVVSTLAIFLPAYLLIVGALPFWKSLRANLKVQGALIAINAAVVGILLAALYNPLWTTAIVHSTDFALALLLFGLLVVWKLPPWIIVLLGAAAGEVLTYLG